MVVMQLQVDREVADKVIQDLRLQVQKLEQQETLLQQLLLREMLEETEFLLVLQDVLNLLVVVVEHLAVEQMLFNQVLQLLVVVLVELELQIQLQDVL